MNFWNPKPSLCPIVLLGAALMGCALLGCVLPAAAHQFVYQHYTEREGLLNNSVNGAVQGPDGLLWFASRGGIMSYDGQQWRPQGVEEGIREKEYSHITQGPDGRIWALSKRVPFRVQVLEDGYWEDLPIPPLPYANTYACLFSVESLDDGSLLVAAAVEEGQFAIWHGEKWELLGAPELTRHIHAWDFHDGRFLVATRRDLLAIDPLNRTVTDARPAALPPGPVLALARDPATADLYHVGPGWIVRQGAAAFDTLATDLELVQGQAWDRTGTLIDRTGGLYFGGLSRAYYFDPRFGLEVIDAATGRPGSGATDFLMDSEGSVWITSLRGVAKLVSRRFASLDRSQGLLQDEVSAVLCRRDGTVVLGHESGLTLLDPEPRPLPFDLPQGTLCRVMDLAEDLRGNLWIATDGNGLALLDRDGHLTWYGPDSGAGERIFSVLVDGREQVWLGQLEGLAVGDRRGFRPVLTAGPDRPLTAFVRKLIPGRSGGLYMTTGRDGVIHYHQGRLRQWRGLSLTEGNSTFDLIETEKEGVWVGTAGGLYVLGDESLERAAGPAPAIERPVYGIAADADGRVWFGTDTGVFIHDPGGLIQYSVADGLIGTEINRAGLDLDERGHLWVGTDRGVSIYRPELDLPPLAPPRLRILGFEADGVPLPGDGPLQLDSPPRTLLVKFRGLWFTDEQHLRFRTRLEGFEPDWNLLPAHHTGEVRYTNLPAGRYRFHLEAVVPSGQHSATAVSPEIRIAPPLTGRWWFLGLGLILVTVTGYLLISFWEGKRHARRLEQQVQLRTRALEQSEQNVRSESQRLAATLNSILDGVLALEEDDTVLMCNPAAEAILDQPAVDLVGKPLDQVLPVVPARIPGEGAADEDWKCHGRIECPRRGTVCLEISSAPLTDPGGLRTGSVVAFRDITDRLRMERELIRSQKLESLGLLAGGIAHDFNNLLTIILGNIDLVESAPGLADPDRESLLLASQASVRARTLTEQLLTFARGGAPVRRVLALGPIVDQSVSLSFSGLNVSCRLDLADDLWLVDVDPGQIHQVLNNLLINAAQAMPDGGQVRVSARNLERAPAFLASGPWVRIDVTDTGQGIPESDLTRIFDPYFTTKSQGTGLGLATSFSIITRHGGKITVDSREGRGSTFSVFLPRAEGRPDQEAPAPGVAAIAGGRVLVLEDEEGIHRVLQKYLDRLDMSVVFTVEGHETLAAYAAARDSDRPFDVVLTDLTIPGGLGGRETLDRLREIDPLVKAVVISGYSHEEVLAHHRQYGFQGALGKPFSFEELTQVLSRVLGEEGEEAAPSA